jgi:hypothetical protein
VNYQSNPAGHFNASAALAACGRHTRSTAYFTDNQFFLTNQVDTPDVVDWISRPPETQPEREHLLHRGRPRGGGDIRRQDMPSLNRVNFEGRRHGDVWIPVLNTLLQFNAGYVVDGRNVGQSTTASLIPVRAHDRGRF